MDRAAAPRGGSRFSGESHRLSRRHGGARAISQALPGVRLAGAAHRVRGERDQLLRALPDWRQDPRRPRPLAPAQSELAALDRRARLNGRPLLLPGLGARFLTAVGIGPPANPQIRRTVMQGFPIPFTDMYGVVLGSMHTVL